MKRTHEMLFEGHANQGLRKRIRDIAKTSETCSEAARRIRLLERVIAFSWAGRSTLESVATDYEILGFK